ncbi:hypothetical protein [Gynuella sunshinyii]|uniref:Uncharacterized protein n=1 Tax=Gynuella sunshinyii YC6258 TaxID=1445510 RepID=A0A0C5VPT1_9GAMM|nr:hypothetical protein [Gynuella sunshinyii]AJQ92249.1 hypothetical Protein YC6258_00197 [Gynuella sunshinyii YC6258]AJQ95804.1 hypothetical Protein YC6258_03768 [Gynuella sunshinyii YC6258]
MKITAVTKDQLIIIDGVPVGPPECSFSMPAGEWAVRFDTDTGIGEVEYLDNRQNEVIGLEDFEQRYTGLVAEHDRVKGLLAE